MPLIYLHNEGVQELIGTREIRWVRGEILWAKMLQTVGIVVLLLYKSANKRAASFLILDPRLVSSPHLPEVTNANYIM